VSDLDNLIQVKTNYTLLLVSVTQVIQNPTQANIEAAVAAANNLGTLTPKPTYSVDGKHYDWVGYQKMIVGFLDDLRKRIQDEGGPFQLVTRAIGG
jgi:hypothetical protein